MRLDITSILGNIILISFSSRTLSDQNSGTLHISSPSIQYTVYKCEVIIEPTDSKFSVSTSVSILCEYYIILFE